MRPPQLCHMIELDGVVVGYTKKQGKGNKSHSEILGWLGWKRIESSPSPFATVSLHFIILPTKDTAC